MNDFHRRERTEIFRTVLDHFSCDENSRETFVLDTNPGIGFIVLQTDIVTRLVFFDQTVFQQQGIQLGIHNKGFDIRDLSDQDGSLPAVVMFFLKIRTDPFFKRFCLTHIEQ